MSRRIISVPIILALVVGLSRAWAQSPATGHFHFAGPMSSFLLPGAAPGSVKSGLGFTVVLSDNGSSISPTTFALRGPQWESDASLTLDGATYAGGSLKAVVRLHNGSGSVLEGVRLDIHGATEEYRAKDADGKDILKTRSQPARIASPLLFGDIPTGADADSCPIEVTGLEFKPETTHISVHGIVSGLYYLGGFNVTTLHGAPFLATDSQGRLYLPDVVGRAVVRAEADGSGAVTVAKLPDQCLGVAVDPASGDLYATAINNPVIFRFSPSGELRGKITSADGLNGWVHSVRAMPDGTLYSDMSGAVARIVGGKVTGSLSQIGADRIGARLFDRDQHGNLWICTSSSLYRSDFSGKSGKRIATGLDWHLGAVNTPNGCRVDAAGQVYVTESENGKEADRISIFDATGAIVRVFGRGASVRTVGAFHPGQIFRATDFAFGADGRVFIAQAGGPGSGNPLIQSFMPF